jgi:hypothetical protein
MTVLLSSSKIVLLKESIAKSGFFFKSHKSKIGTFVKYNINEFPYNESTENKDIFQKHLLCYHLCFETVGHTKNARDAGSLTFFFPNQVISHIQTPRITRIMWLVQDHIVQLKKTGNKSSGIHSST